MLSRNDFELWVRSCHHLFTIFEGRSDLYPLSLQLVEEYWRNNGKYHIDSEVLKSLHSKLRHLNYKNFGIEGDLERIISNAFNEFISRHFIIGEHDNIGIAIAPYLFTWNIRRFEEYLQENPQFNLSNYFIDLGRELSMLKDDIVYFRGKRLIESDIDADERKIINLFTAVEGTLKKIRNRYVTKDSGKGEPVGTIKILHILAPHYFPLLDNPIAEAVELKREKESIKYEHYITWMKRLQLWLQNYADVLKELEKEFELPMLKLVDEAFYVMGTVDLSRRVKLLEIPQP